ncbi:adenine deaminase [Shimazuella sp. AN120528]|uniref:adenine deaminase n=1 Tax=Shimazuella soli TaxID=1892854 RepID=UPI001F0D4DD8|nr:adenine deaminase [Shimazuella soli]MCH5583703.1 adenine deaminase [Shimazuella soli]
MKLSPEQLQRRIAVASKREPADLVITNGKIIDVFNLNIIHADIAIADGYIVGIGNYRGKQVLDAKQKYICPTFIDAHVHIESSLVTPQEFAKVVLPHGITTVITDPHEIANVVGNDGIAFMLADSEELPLDIYLMLPSSVPATPFENAGARLKANDLEPFFTHPRVLGLAEVMDFPAVLHGENQMIKKISTTLKYRNHIDGHAAGLDKDAINVYRSAGIITDHECISAEEALERIQRGMYVWIREGSSAKDLTSLIRIVNEKNSRRFAFCTDDKHLDELITEGSIDHSVRLAIQHGLDPLLAIQLATLNAAECYGLQQKGAIAPGYVADFLLFDDLMNLKVQQVFKAGRLIAENGQMIISIDKQNAMPSAISKTIHVVKPDKHDLQIPINGTKANVIEIQPNSLVTKHKVADVTVSNGYFVPSVKMDQLKIAVLERHHRTGNIGLGIVSGLGILSGAIASTVAHDSHNLVVAGTNDDDMLTAIEEITRLQGGLVVVKNGKTLASLPLEIAGLMSSRNFTDVNKNLKQLHHALDELHAPAHLNPFSILAFLCLPVIPEIKLTDIGLFDVTAFQHIPVSVS